MMKSSRLNRIRMIYKGPNTETLFTQKIDMNYEKDGNLKCIQEFNIDNDTVFLFDWDLIKTIGWFTNLSIIINPS